MDFVKWLQGSIQDDNINIKTDYPELRMERPSVWVYGVLTFYLFTAQLKKYIDEEWRCLPQQHYFLNLVKYIN